MLGIPLHQPTIGYPKKASSMVADAVVEFPSTIADLISSYLPDYSLAVQALEFDEHGKVMNPEVRTAILCALIDPDCDPSIKTAIFKSCGQSYVDYGDNLDEASLQASQRKIYCDAMNVIFNTIGQEGYRLNLDGMKLRKLFLSGLNLRGMSAVGAEFIEVTFCTCKMGAADLRWSQLHHVDFLVNDLSGTDMRGCTYTNCRFRSVIRNGLLTDEPGMLTSYDTVSDLRDPFTALEVYTGLTVNSTASSEQPAPGEKRKRMEPE